MKKLKSKLLILCLSDMAICLLVIWLVIGDVSGIIPSGSLFFWMTSGLLAVILVLATFQHIHGVYKPMTQMEAALELIRKNEPISSAKETRPGNSYLDEINRILVEFQRNLNEQYSERILNKQAEINALQSQINPHFLYNTLESIRGLAIIKDVGEIADMTEAFAAFFRYSISRTGNNVTLEDELKNVRHYFKIQEYRFSSRYRMVEEFDPDEDLMQYALPKLTIQPIVENAIYHGLETKTGPGTIKIRVYTTTDRLAIIISDDGVGIKEETLDGLNARLKAGAWYNEREDEEKTGIALTNVNKRIKLCFGDAYGLSISSTLGLGTDVEINLPLVGERKAGELS